MRKPAFCMSENKGADQMRYIHGTIPLLRNIKPLTMFSGSTAWFALNVVGNPKDRVSHDTAQSFSIVHFIISVLPRRWQ